MLAPSPWSPPVAAEVRESLQAVLTSAVAYLETRWQIAHLESKEALRVGMGVALLGLIMVLCLTIAYVGIVIAGMWWISQHWGDGDLVWPACAVIGGHLVLAVLCAWWATRAVRRGRLFHATRKEFMEDKLWLQTNQASRN